MSFTARRAKADRKAKGFRRIFNIALVEGHKLAAESPDISGAAFRHQLKNILDDIFELPPIAEEISDIGIAIIVDACAWRIRETDSKHILVTREWVKYAKECVEYSEAAAKKKKKRTKKDE